MILPQHVIEIALPQVSIVYGRRDGEWTLGVLGQPELIPDQRRTPGCDRVVVSHRMDRPHLVVIHEISGQVDRPIGKAMGAWFQRSIRPGNRLS